LKYFFVGFSRGREIECFVSYEVAKQNTNLVTETYQILTSIDNYYIIYSAHFGTLYFKEVTQMKKIAWKDFVVGGIYCRVYVGPNTSYSKINGKWTFRVLTTTPELTVRILFSEFGNALVEEITSDIITFTHPDIAFTGYEIFEPANEDEWFKKSARFTSLQDAIDAGLIREIDVLKHTRFIACTDEKGKLVGVRTHFPVEGKTKFPFMQSVFLVWKDWDCMRADYATHGKVVSF